MDFPTPPADPYPEASSSADLRCNMAPAKQHEATWDPQVSQLSDNFSEKSGKTKNHDLKISSKTISHVLANAKRENAINL
jgi:hypothetical protein